LNDRAPAALQSSFEKERQNALERLTLEVIEENLRFIGRGHEAAALQNLFPALEVRSEVSYLSWSGAAPSWVTPVRAVSAAASSGSLLLLPPAAIPAQLSFAPLARFLA